jgi:polyhydroxyalkanoate synthase
VRQSYLLNTRYVLDAIDALGLDERTRERLRFAARQMTDAFSPANFAATNPEVLKLALETQGASLLEGLRNFFEDTQKGRISTTDESVFEVGKNIAVTEGAVVFRNELIELIQYKPLTEQVHARPLLMVPPCINKYYILDLQPHNSLVRYMVEQGHTVFMVSWRNPQQEQSRLDWDDYLRDGVICAINEVREIAGLKKINAMGFCVGGTLLASALAVMAARGEDPLESLTLLASMLDFSDTGEISLFVDEASVAAREAAMGKGGIMPGKELAFVFSALRANDLVWSYVVNNYLKGRHPEAFDLLYWNSDGSNLPGVMYRYYLRNTYLENNLRIPGKLLMCGEPVDLGRIDMPAYLLAAREDHIVPWRTAYASTTLLGGPLQFVLAASGHIAGVINPAARNKRNFWTRDTLEPQADAWLEGAASTPGRWWTHWTAWLENHGGGQTAAPAAPGSATHPPLEPAPGRYVKDKNA